jgi:transposase
MNLIFGLALRGVLAPLVYTGTTTAPFFTAYSRQCLLQELQPHNLVVADHHPAHTAAVGALIRRAGGHFWWLPTYSPDLSPIEYCGSKVKETLRRAEPRTLDAMVSSVSKSLANVTSQDIMNWFRHCGIHI